MLVLEFKVKAKPHQYQAINEAIPIAQFIQNKCLRYWMDNKGVNKYDINKQCAILAKEFDFASTLNSMARQSSAERAWSAITRFYNNCQKKVKGKKGFPKFKKNCPSVKYKTTGWKLDESNRKAITITDKTGIGRLKLIGTYDLNFYSLDHIKLQKSVSKKFKKGPALSWSLGQHPSNNYKKAKQKLAKAHLRISRQRKEHAKRLARCVILSHDVVVYEDLKIRNMVKNQKLAKSINDVGWYQFRVWLEYFGQKFGKVTIAVPPQYTSQDCSNCGERVEKSLSTRTHKCPHCEYIADRDENAAINILRIGLSTVGHRESQAWGEETSTLVEVIQLEQVTEPRIPVLIGRRVSN